MPVEYLSVEQEARYGRFAAEPSPGELEQFFRLDFRGPGVGAGQAPSGNPAGLLTRRVAK